MAPFRDRLSTLPDELIFNIISSLPFKEAVRTTVLAKRWKTISPGIKKMEFHEKDFVTAQENPARENQRRNFISLVLRWITTAHPGQWKTFSLAFSDPQEFQPQLQQCIQLAIARNPQLFSVDFSNPGWDEEEDDVVNYYARIKTAVQLPLLGKGDLGDLRTLHLSSCYFPGSTFTELRSVALAWIRVEKLDEMLHKCAFLETLKMKNCTYGVVEIFSKSLRSLVMEKCRSAYGSDSRLNLDIDVPEMKRFVYSGVLFSLSCASLNLDLETSLDFVFASDVFDDFGDILYEVVHNLGGVRTLTVCTYMLQTICLVEEDYMKPKLERLKHLTLKASLIQEEFYGITFLLCSCPNLEVLTVDLNTPVRIFEDYEDVDSDILKHPFMNPSMARLYPCMKRKLKRLVVGGFRGTDDELLVLRYLLRYCKVLETLEVTISKERDADGNSLEQVYADRVLSMFSSKKVGNKANLELLLNRN